MFHNVREYLNHCNICFFSIECQKQTKKGQNGPFLTMHSFFNTYQDRPMYLIRAVTVHSNRPKEVWFGPSAYTARILWSGGKFFLIEGPQRPPSGLSGLHVVPPLPSPAAYVRPSPLPTPPLCAGACAPLGNAGMWCERAYGLCVCHPGITRGAHISSACPTVSKPSCSSCTTVSSTISLISSPIGFVFFPTYVILFPLPAHVYRMS